MEPITPVANQDPLLPLDIEREIFQMAFHFSPSSGPNLMLVACRVHRWIASLLYKVAQQLVSPYFPQTGSIDSPQLDYFGKFVKHLIIGGAADIHKISEFLNACPDVVDLALWTSHPTKEFLNSIEKASLQRLSTNLTSLDEHDFKGPAFSSITHLDITVFKGDWTRWKVLAHVPRLTHIAINEVVDMKAVYYLLQHCSELRILLVMDEIMDDTISRWNLAGVQLYDPRFVMISIQRYTLDEWENGTNGKEDIWVCAEAISSSKTYGRFKKEDFLTWFSRYSWREELNGLEAAAS